MTANRACGVTMGALLLAAACGDSNSPSTPTAAPPPPASTANLAVFSNPSSALQTTDVFDSNGEVVRFNTVESALLWVAGDLFKIDINLAGGKSTGAKSMEGPGATDVRIRG